MSPITISFVLVRLAAIFLFVRGVQGLSIYSFYISDYSTLPTFGLVTLVFSVVLPIGVAFLLWQHPEKVTGAQVVDPKLHGPVSADQLLMIGVTLFGMYLLVYGALDLVRVESLVAAREQAAIVAGLPSERSEPQVRASRLIYAAQILIGTCMVIGRRRMSDLLLKAKYGAVQAQ